jgi:hypothetical protein
MPYNCEKVRKTLLILLLSVAGCVVAERPEVVGPAEYTQRIVENTTNKLDWLTVVGAGTVAFGVAGYFAGNTAATATIAAGITLTAIGLFITVFLPTICEYRKWFMLAFIVLGIIAFFTFARSVADVNRDGKIDWQDLKALLLKLKRK